MKSVCTCENSEQLSEYTLLINHIFSLRLNESASASPSSLRLSTDALSISWAVLYVCASPFLENLTLLSGVVRDLNVQLLLKGCG